MKRYLLFSYISYESDGGINDLIGDYDSIDEALRTLDDYFGEQYDEIKNDLPKNPQTPYQSKKKYIEYQKRFQTTHIYDTVERVKVYETR